MSLKIVHMYTHKYQMNLPDWRKILRIRILLEIIETFLLTCRDS